MPYKDPEKQKAAKAAHYQKNKADYVAREVERARANRRKIQVLKEASPCFDCNIYHPYWRMHYDHTGNDKVSDISKLVKRAGWNTVLAEIEKCELVCGNCHADRTHERQMLTREFKDEEGETEKRQTEDYKVTCSYCGASKFYPNPDCKEHP